MVGWWWSIQPRFRHTMRPWGLESLTWPGQKLLLVLPPSDVYLVYLSYSDHSDHSWRSCSYKLGLSYLGGPPSGYARLFLCQAWPEVGWCQGWAGLMLNQMSHIKSHIHMHVCLKNPKDIRHMLKEILRKSPDVKKKSTMSTYPEMLSRIHS